MMHDQKFQADEPWSYPPWSLEVLLMLLGRAVALPHGGHGRSREELQGGRQPARNALLPLLQRHCFLLK
jgi:hypothetical protein